MGLVSVTQVSDGNTASAADINGPVNTIVTAINGNLDSTNLAANAVSTSKVQDGAVTPVKMANQYKFSAYVSSAFSLPSGTFTRIPVNTKNFDTGNNLDVTTNVGRYTAPIAGYYRFDGHLHTAGIGATIRVITALYKNGTEYCFGNDATASTNYIGSNVGEVIQLAAGDYVEFFAIAVGSGQSIDTAFNRTRFSGYLVSVT